MTEVSATQPCTRSKTPRLGSTARSGTRPSLTGGNRERQARSSMGVVKRTSTRGCFASVLRPRGSDAELQGGAGRAKAWVFERGLSARGVGRWRRKPHARESNTSRVHGSHVGCRSREEASRLDPSASVLLGSHGSRQQRHGTETSAARRPLPRRGSESDSRRAQGCGTECAFIIGRARRSTRREPSIDSMEGAPDHEAFALNPRGRSDPRPHRQYRPFSCVSGRRAARRGARSAPPKHRCGDTGRQRSHRLVRLPQPKGAGGQPATVRRMRFAQPRRELGLDVLRQTRVPEAAMAKNLRHSRMGAAARTARPVARKSAWIQ